MSTAAAGLKIKDHGCALKFYDWDEKINSAYSGGFSCNICRKNYGKTISNFHCTKCSYDICEKCLYNEVSKDLNQLKK